MFTNFYVFLDSEGVLAIILIILGLMLLLYLILVILSFMFMFNFKRDINRRKDFMNVTLYQKFDLLIKLSVLLNDYLDENSPLKILSNNDEFKSYQRIDTKDFEEFYVYSEKMLQQAQKVYINNDLSDKKSKVEEAFLTIGELDEKYLQAVQLYNTSVIGYNYWYNFFSTKWIKKILFIKKIDTIK